MPTSAARSCQHCDASLNHGERACPSCGRSIEAERDFYSGKVLLGKYRCIERIGSGATSQVYKAQHGRLASLRAIKILRGELRNDPRAVEAFWREAHIASLLRSPNIAILHDVDALPDATPCSIWEYLDGPLLADRVAQAPLGPDTAQVLRGLCNALDALHQKGWAHLDLCPQNILLGTGEHALEAHLIDFGEARIHGSSDERASEALRLGYSAPEQVFGGAPVDARADVFALGALICFACTGHPPLISPNLTAYGDWLRHLQPQRLRSLEPLPPPLRRVVERCLEPDPALRPENAAALREELRRAGRDSGVAQAVPAGNELATALPASRPARPSRVATEKNDAPTAMPHELSGALLAEGSTNQMAADGAKVPQPPAAHSPRPSARLEPISGLASKVPFTIGVLTSIGRSAGNEVMLDHATVSKHHGQIRFEDGRFVYEDLGSRNGSTVAGKKATTPIALKDNDKLILGEVVLRFRIQQH